ASGGMACYLPKLYKYYYETMEGLLDHHPTLLQLFRNSVFPVATFNLGPAAVTAEHCDYHNNPHGMCTITSGGRFDHIKG
ncbi:hypothetical protein C8R44DRAFT_648828, partial [Mycena epipterygia]